MQQATKNVKYYAISNIKYRWAYEKIAHNVVSIMGVAHSEYPFEPQDMQAYGPKLLKVLCYKCRLDLLRPEVKLNPLAQ